MYISARREILEEELDPSAITNTVNFKKWPAIHPIALASEGASDCL